MVFSLCFSLFLLLVLYTTQRKISVLPPVEAPAPPLSPSFPPSLSPSFPTLRTPSASPSAPYDLSHTRDHPFRARSDR
jgi:hypothetical protein